MKHGEKPHLAEKIEQSKALQQNSHAPPILRSPRALARNHSTLSTNYRDPINLSQSPCLLAFVKEEAPPSGK